jgi:XRE family aerobic/anaerobic benzoate catabolism transcriptional regulator
MGARAHKTIENAPAQDPHEDTSFLRAIGERVRNVRQQRNITRKVLADRSGVSERYLAQLESGLGNVSVLVLRDVALALDLRADALLRDANDESPEIGLIQQLLRRMTPQRLAQTRERLLRDLRDHPQERSSRIALVGLRGAGKTTLGEKLAQSLQRPFVELDREIEREAGTGLSEIFLLYGQQGYRRYERRCLEHILGTGQACVIATGGSIVSEPSTYELLLSTCFTVWLKATPEEHMQRVIAQGDMRPMAGRAQAMDDLRRILESRTGLYARADATVNTAGKNVRQALSVLKQLAMRK